MTTRPDPPCKPDDREPAIRELLDALSSVSQEILVQSAQPDVATLSQLVLRRAQLIQALETTGLQDLSPDFSRHCQETLTACQAMDGEIERRMRAFQVELDEHLKACRSSRRLLARYKHDDDTGGRLRSEEA